MKNNIQSSRRFAGSGAKNRHSFQEYFEKVEKFSTLAESYFTTGPQARAQLRSFRHHRDISLQSIQKNRNLNMWTRKAYRAWYSALLEIQYRIGGCVGLVMFDAKHPRK